MSRLALLLLCLISAALLTLGQTKQPAPPKPSVPVANAARNAEAKAEAERTAKERRAQARSLLLSLASHARGFRDQPVRARTLARIADALWDTDVERGRELFRKAWEAAVVADQETIRKRNEDIQRQKSTTGGGYAIPAYPNVRRDVLQLAARRDRELGEEFLQRLKDEDDVNGGNQRMNLASELLESGDSERALQFASAELATITASSVDFLSSLREKNAVGADERYAIMLDTVARNVLSDANTISLLSSYIFTPHVFVLFHHGAMSYGMMGSGPPADVAPELRLRFFQAAATVLLRSEPQSAPEQTTGPEDQYLVIKRLSPWFDQYAPPELAAAMRTRLDGLGALVRESVRGRNPNPNPMSESESSDREQTTLDKIEHAKTSDERDRLYFDLAQQAAWKGDLRARDFAGKIEDTEFRKKAQPHIDVTLATNLIQRKKTSLALDLVPKADLTHIQRVWLLTQLAKLLAQTDREKSLSLLEDALPEARRIEGSDPDRPRALLAIADAQRLVEPSRTWDAVFEAVKAANSAETFTGEDGNLNILFQAKGFSSASDQPTPDFDIKGIFSALAEDDYDRAVGLAGSFQGEAPRAAAVIAIARSILVSAKGKGQGAKR